MSAKITNSTLKHRFESEQGKQTAFLNYRINGNRITLTHTEVPKLLEGRGIGTELVKAALSYARDNQLLVVAQCPFVAEFVAKHPQYQALVAK